MHQLKFFVIPFLLIFAACDTTEVNTQTEQEPELTIDYLGGLNTTFQSDQASFAGNAGLIKLSETSGRIDIQLIAQTKSAVKKEHAGLIFRIIYESENGLISERNYINKSDDQSIPLGEGEYRLVKSNTDYSNYQFIGTYISLKVTQSTSNRISGSFILYLNQSAGQRMIDGQLEDLTLSSPTQVMGKFDLELREF